MIKKIFMVLLLLTSTSALAFTEITKPEELATCLQNYIQKRITYSSSVSWEHLPKFEFAGKYLSASWNSGYPISKYGSMFAFVGPRNDVYCDYPTDSTGLPLWNQGFCKANIDTGSIILEYTKYDKNGNAIKQNKRIGFIQNLKLFCTL